jgi:hypothetical protein
MARGFKRNTDEPPPIVFLSQADMDVETFYDGYLAYIVVGRAFTSSRPFSSST